MQDSTVSRQSALHATNSAAAERSLGGSLALVVGFWWAATGVTLAMQRSALMSTASITIASVVAVGGVFLIYNTRTETTVRGARLAFLGSSFIWWWCSTLFYAGFGVQIGAPSAAASPSWPLAMQAIGATLRADLIGVAALLAVSIMVWRRPNRVALWALAAFWGTLQTAKLNVFMGVRNSGADWLPEHLEPLSQFFGPPQNSWLLPFTVLLLTGCFLASSRAAQQARTPFERHALAMTALLLALAVIEHVFLGINFTLPLWDIFRVQP